MAFTEIEIHYLAGQRLGRLATLRPDGTLQNSPVGYRYHAATGTIDVAGHRLTDSRKYRNVAANGQVAFVVDDLVSTTPWRVRCLEVRGTAEAIEHPADSPYGDAPIIRIHPRQIISFGLDELDTEPHQLVPSNRKVAG
ncbi:PPOX class F420-dependent oxidoreductase [Actinoplanes aureus]|uniref:PPOX class F420-dependent oxidoreductase n=1 Tax=Actinoplanes aureus TaxID=2792083 RepID=A0A931CBR3_9ACTN|nr:PPOX class F420-dependent oxidoreductase [Actinoplanes aureus]MBG0564487.1 PPOX class F420-dependent oxidoreductase [Actinoplanes aureus]